MGYDHEEYFEEDDDDKSETKPDMKSEFVQQTRKSRHCNNNYTSNDCGKLFSSKGSLAIHRKSFHLGNSFLCSFCPLKS